MLSRKLPMLTPEMMIPPKIPMTLPLLNQMRKKLPMIQTKNPKSQRSQKTTQTKSQKTTQTIGTMTTTTFYGPKKAKKTEESA